VGRGRGVFRFGRELRFFAFWRFRFFQLFCRGDFTQLFFYGRFKLIPIIIMDINSSSAFGGVACGQFSGANPHSSLIRRPLAFGLTPLSTH